jgi:hypothetical protein
MPLQLTKSLAHTFRTATLIGLLCLSTTPSQADIFDNMRGAWTGGGTITLSSGAHERIRCRAQYIPSGPSVQMILRCASDSYKFELTSTIAISGGQLSGKWSESNRQLDGNISGTASPGIIQAVAMSPLFSAFLNVRTSATTQSVSILSPGSEIASVSIALKR